MAPRPVMLAVALAVSACAAPGPRPPALAPDELLAASRSDPSASVDIVSRDAVFALDDAMRAFVARHVDGGARPGVRLEQLLAAMRDTGLFDLGYATEATLTASETFHRRYGNCLSFTILFVALAREAGLNASFQLVEIPPRWTGNANYVILNNHINALIRTFGEPGYVVDFNIDEYKGDYPVMTVGDDYALALFYSNRGVEALTAARQEASFEYFRRSIEAFPDIAGPWINLGVLYSSLGRAEEAESAYLHGLAADRRNRSALVNLAKLYRDRGEHALANEYTERVRRYQQRNPYYHYALANSAYEGNRPREALELVDRAIRLKKDEHRFHYLRALAFYELGDVERARNSLVRALDHADGGDVRNRYAAELSALGGG